MENVEGEGEGLKVGMIRDIICISQDMLDFLLPPMPSYLPMRALFLNALMNGGLIFNNKNMNIFS